MKKTIWKSTLSLAPSQVLQLPQGAKFLTIQDQAGELTVWYECYPDRASGPRTIVLVGTGHDLPDTHVLRYLATVQQGEFVWHFYETDQ